MRYGQQIRHTAACFLFATAISSLSQRKPDLGIRPEPGPNRLEVRFASGEKALTCRLFSLRIERSGRVLVDGKFTSGFQLPTGEVEPSFEEKLDVQVSCGEHLWHFSRVPSGALVQGWWWVGTDYPPFQSEFGGQKFANCRAIRYLIVDPTHHAGFDYFETTPSTLDDSHEACTGG
jgi:hypothetical protein